MKSWLKKHLVLCSSIVSACMLVAIAPNLYAGQPTPLKVAVAIVVRNPAVAVPAGFTIFSGAKGIETPGFDFQQTLKTEFLAALDADKRVQCRSIEGAPELPEKDADRLLLIDVEIIQAIKKILEPTSFTMSGRILLVDGQGKKTWSERFSETAKVKGTMEEFVRDDQRGLKAALDKLIEQFVQKKTAKFGKLKVI
jgi:hypothetical protein